jgi:hypothetical protein
MWMLAYVEFAEYNLTVGQEVSWITARRGEKNRRYW